MLFASVITFFSAQDDTYIIHICEDIYDNKLSRQKTCQTNILKPCTRYASSLGNIKQKVLHEDIGDRI